MVSANEALQRLRDGNQRFVADTRRPLPPIAHARSQLTVEQKPFAIILGCSDSRTPTEILFDQGLGDLFVVRVAGNVAAPCLVGSVEYAAVHLGTRLVVVLGHTGCGAISATLSEIRRPAETPSPNIQTIVDYVRPSFQNLLATKPPLSDEQLLSDAVRAHVRASASYLRHGSAVLESLIENDGLVVVGAEYSLHSGVVDFFDGVPE